VRLADLRGRLNNAHTTLHLERDRWAQRLKLDEEQSRLIAGLRVGGAR
jgi:hypothetical protein